MPRESQIEQPPGKMNAAAERGQLAAVLDPGFRLESVSLQEDKHIVRHAAELLLSVFRSAHRGVRARHPAR